MKSRRSSMFAKTFVLVIGLLSASAGLAHAQSAANGTFTLAHETRWGSVALPAGDYTFSLQSPGMPAAILVRQTSGHAMAMVLPQAITQESLNGASKLVLSRTERGQSFVSVLYLEDLGLTLHFTQPKIEAQATETAKLGPIADPQPGK
jgi:hypothetical protein